MDFREREIGIHRPHRLTDRGHQCPPIQCGGCGWHKPQVDVFPGPVAGADVDMFWAYSRNSQGTLTGPVWQKNLEDGLDAPKLVLFEDFRKDVTVAATKQAKKHTPRPKNTP
jgi:hypothetical protein